MWTGAQLDLFLIWVFELLSIRKGEPPYSKNHLLLMSTWYSIYDSVLFTLMNFDWVTVMVGDLYISWVLIGWHLTIMIEIVVLMQDKHTLMGLPCLKMSNGGRVIVIFTRQFFSGIHLYLYSGFLLVLSFIY